MTDKLLPCPFCGGEAGFIFCSTGANDCSVAHIECENRSKVNGQCSICPTTDVIVVYDDTWDEQCSELASAWNTRAPIGDKNE